jgi:hypothetical protein
MNRWNYTSTAPISSWQSAYSFTLPYPLNHLTQATLWMKDGIFKLVGIVDIENGF